jgi:hypothetical protein
MQIDQTVTSTDQKLANRLLFPSFLLHTVGEVGLRKHRPRPPALAPSVCLQLRSGGMTLRCTGTNETLMPLMPHESRCAGMTPCGGAYLRRRRCRRPCSGDEGPGGPGAGSAGRGYRVRGRRRRGQGVCGGSTPLIQGRCFVAEGATTLDTWPPPTCKVGSGQGRDKGGRV